MLEDIGKIVWVWAGIIWLIIWKFNIPVLEHLGGICIILAAIAVCLFGVKLLVNLL